MKIDKNKLIDLLVEKTEMNREEIKNQMDQLIERILDAAKRGKALEIKEFGLFYFDEEGELSFDPAEELSTEISFKYAGMKPVELKPERDTSIFETEETGEDEDEDETDPFESSKSKEELEDDNLYDDPFAPEAMEPLEEPAEEEPKSKRKNVNSASRQPIKRQRDHTGVFILIGIIIVAVLIGGYFYYTGTQPQDADEQTETATQTETNQGQGANIDDPITTDAEAEADDHQPQSNQEMPDEGQPAAEQQDTEPVSEEEIVSDAGLSISETEQPMYGLRGSVIEEANSGYSIVLHSFNSEDRAETAANQLREDNFRVIVTSRSVYENTVWRVSVGQFETLEDAQQAITGLPAPYNTQNFIQRIRI